MNTYEVNVDALHERKNWKGGLNRSTMIIFFFVSSIVFVTSPNCRDLVLYLVLSLKLCF